MVNLEHIPCEAQCKTYPERIPGHIPDRHFPDGLFSGGHFPDRHFPDQTHSRWRLPQLDTSPTDISPTRQIPDGHFLYQTHPRRTLPRPDTSPTDTSPTRHIPDGHFPDQANAQQIFARVDTSHNGHFPDRLNTSNNLKYSKKYIVRAKFGNIHAVVRTLEIQLEVK